LGLTFAALLPPCAVDPPPLEVLVQQLINGVVLGSLIGLIAIGYTLVYGIIQLINFAHGEVFMVGAYGGLATFSYLLPTGIQQRWYLALPLVVLGGVVVSMAVALLMERFAYRPLRNAPRLAPLITALGVSVFLQEAVRNFYPNAKSAIAFPSVFISGGADLPVGGGTVTVPWSAVLLVVVALALGIGLQVFVERSRTGRAMRATSSNRDVARLMGINPDRVIVFTFVLGGAFAGIGGVLYGGYLSNINIDIGFQNGIFAFTAAVLGGIGSTKGALTGGLCIGLIKTLGGQCLWGGTSYDYVWVFVVLIAVLVFRPQGIFGETERVRA
jgi:branched-chain amino acid transport system permease protein